MTDSEDRDLDEILRDCVDKAQVNVGGGYRGTAGGGGRVHTLPFHGQIVMDLKPNKMIKIIFKIKILAFIFRMQEHATALYIHILCAASLNGGHE